MHQFRAAHNLELAHQPSFVGLDRLHAQKREFRDLTVAVAQRKKPEYLALSFAEGGVAPLDQAAGSARTCVISSRRVARQLS